MSICLTWFPISGLGEPKIYHQSVCITRMWELLTGDDGVDGGDFTWRVVNMDLKC